MLPDVDVGHAISAYLFEWCTATGIHCFVFCLLETENQDLVDQHENNTANPLPPTGVESLTCNCHA
jgi:hypothetical protein